jgi:hypothetical protein
VRFVDKLTYTSVMHKEHGGSWFATCPHIASANADTAPIIC